MIQNDEDILTDDELDQSNVVSFPKIGISIKQNPIEIDVNPIMEDNVLDPRILGEVSKVREWSGKDLSKASDWIRKFRAISTLYQWPEENRCLIFRMAMTGGAATWLETLDQEDPEIRNNIEAMLERFESEYVNNEPVVCIENSLHSRRWAWERGESIDAYRSALAEIGHKLGKHGDDLATYFLRGLPESCQTFCLSSDSHTLDSYVKRARLWRSLPSTQSSNQGAQSQPVTATVNQIAEVLKTFNINERGEERQENRSRYRDDRSPYRSYRDGRSPYRSYRDNRSPYRAYHSPQRGRSPNNRDGYHSRQAYSPRDRYARKSPGRDRDDRSSSRERRTSNWHRRSSPGEIRCDRCTGFGHIARDCASKRRYNEDQGRATGPERSRRSTPGREAKRCHICDSDEHLAADCTQGASKN